MKYSEEMSQTMIQIQEKEKSIEKLEEILKQKMEENRGMKDDIEKLNDIHEIDNQKIMD